MDVPVLGEVADGCKDGGMMVYCGCRERIARRTACNRSIWRATRSLDGEVPRSCGSRNGLPKGGRALTVRCRYANYLSRVGILGRRHDGPSTGGQKTKGRSEGKDFP